MVLRPVACGAVTTIFGFVLVLLASILAALALLGVRGYWQAGRVSNQYQQAVDRVRQRNLFPVVVLCCLFSVKASFKNFWGNFGMSSRKLWKGEVVKAHL